MRLRAVSLDLFDTLVDLRLEGLPRLCVLGEERPSTLGPLHGELAARADVPVSLDAFARALREVDLSHRKLRYDEGREVSSEQRFAQALAQLGVADPGLPGILTDLHMGLLRAQVAVPGHHAGLLEALAARVRLGLCSNFTHARTARRILAETRLDAHLVAVAISDEVGLRKPRREIFEALLAKLGAAPEETLHVGDNLRSDVGGAAALGMRTAWITRRVPDRAAALSRHSGPAPDWIVSDLAELLPLLDEARSEP